MFNLLHFLRAHLFPILIQNAGKSKFPLYLWFFWLLLFRSAGVILYECIFGRAPFSSDSMEQVISQLLSPDPIEIPQAQISYECRDLLGSIFSCAHFRAA